MKINLSNTNERQAGDINFSTTNEKNEKENMVVSLNHRLNFI